MVLALKSNFKDEYSIEKFKEIVLADKYTEILKMRERKLYNIEKRISRGLISISEALTAAQSVGEDFVYLVYQEDLGVNGYKEFNQDIEKQLESQDINILFQREIFMNQSNDQLSKKMFQIRRKEYDGEWSEWQDIKGDFVYTVSSYGFSPNLESGIGPDIDITSSELKKRFREQYQIRSIQH